MTAAGSGSPRRRLIGRIDRRDAVWLTLLSLTFFVLLLPISSYVAALSYIKQEWDLNNTQAGREIGRASWWERG